jgi:phenylalanyl-tRNA synthetase beta chain
MQFPESWLREFCDPPIDSRQLAELLTMAGMEVEDLRPVAPPFEGVVVGRIVDCAPHPNADRLRVCTVDVGGDQPLGIVCGAPNARAGLLAPCALVGAKLPPDPAGKVTTIGLGKLRGVESRGMLCSARELGLSEDHGGLLELPADAPVGQDVRALLQLDDMLFTLKLTPNLGHCLSVYGIAREVAALTGAPLRTPAIAPVAAVHDERVPVELMAPDLCGRFSGRVIRNVDPRARTPDWMVRRLERCGQRSVAPLVDISNYVMFEYGRPSHIFDRDKIHGHLEVRWARPGETLKLLNGQTVELDAQVGVIADAQAVESLAGIMGGDATAVSDATRNVYVEAAFWWPAAVAGRSRRFNFSTDAGHRFERGVDPDGTVLHIERISALIQQICGGDPGPIDDQTSALPERRPVRMRVARAAKVLGMPVTQPECAGVFRRLGLPHVEVEGAIDVTPPSWRFDLAIEEDLIEEVARVLGYGRLPDAPPQAPVTARVAPESRRSVHALRRLVAGLDYQETINYSFVDARWEHELAGNEAPIRVLNPIASQMAVMRSSLIGSLVDVLRRNLDRRIERVRVFEIGRVFVSDASAADGPGQVAGLRQPRRLAALAYGPALPTQWAEKARAVDFYDVKGDLERLLLPRRATFRPCAHAALHPGRAAQVELEGRVIGVLGQLHPRWCQRYELPQAPVLFELELDAVLEHPLPVLQPLARFHPVRRDLSIVVADGVTHDAIGAAMDSAALGEALRSWTLYDIYKPEQPASDIGAGERSLAIRLELQGWSATLTDAEIDALVARVLESLRKQVGARLRA